MKVNLEHISKRQRYKNGYNKNGLIINRFLLYNTDIPNSKNKNRRMHRKYIRGVG